MTQAMLNQSNRTEVKVPILEAKLFEGILENKVNRLFSTAPQLPEAIIGPYYTMRAAGKGTWQFLRYRRADNKESLLVVTAPFDLYCGPMIQKNDSVSFGLDREEAPGLHELISMVEGQVHDYLLEKAVKDLPDEVYEANIRTADRNNLVRPQAGGKRVFVEPSTDCVTFNWDGTKTLTNEWGSGRYQLILRLSNIFVGQGTKYGFYLQWKIAQIRYNACDLSICSRTRHFLFDDGKKPLPSSSPEEEEEEQVMEKEPEPTPGPSSSTTTFDGFAMPQTAPLKKKKRSNTLAIDGGGNSKRSVKF